MKSSRKMYPNRRRLVAAISCLTLAEAFACEEIYLNDHGGLFAFHRPDLKEPAAALAALATPPPGLQSGHRLHSDIPAGTRILGLRTEGDTTVVEFSPEVLVAGMDEITLTSIFRQVKATLYQFGYNGSIRLQAGGKPLSSYLPAINPVTPADAPQVTAPQINSVSPAVATQPSGPLVNSLLSKKIALSPGHGYFWNGGGWATQRPVYCSPLNEEDLHTLEIVQYLNTYLLQDGATTKPYRCVDKSFGNHSSGNAWWTMAAYAWEQNQGYSCAVYASSTGDCTTGTGGSEINDDIRARPLAADADNTDIYVSLHSNGFTGNCTGSCPSGTETYYDTQNPQPTASQSLANAINPALMSAIQANCDSSWTCHGACVKNANGAYGEIRIPNRAATLTELAFHDTCDRDADANHLRDNFFRCTAAWGMYKGICDYFGVAPTWAFLSDEFVSHDIPATMTPGQVATVHITFRNRGVLWNDARGFQLGAVGGSDPFTTTTGYTPGEVGPNTTKTFTLTFTAPGTPGTYTTDWQLMRNGAGFGATLTVNVSVSSPTGAPTITTQPQSQAVTAGANAAFTVTASGTGPLSYQWRFNGGSLSGATASGYTRSNAQPGDAGSYSVLITNTAGSATSSNAVLTVNVPPTMTIQPVSQIATQGVSVTFTAAATGTTPLSYQWRKNAANVSGATATSYTLNNVQNSDTATYSVQVSNGAGNATSSNAVLTVIGLPSITTQPQSQAVSAGATVNFTVVASGNPVLTYQWRKNALNLGNGGNISGAATATLTIANVQQADIAAYSVVVANTNGSVTSADASLALGTLSGGWWGDWDGNPTTFGGSWATTTDCSTYWYIYSHFSSCVARGFNMTFNPGFAWNGRGYIHCDWVNAGAKADTVLTMRWRKQDGTLSGTTTGWDDCAHTCSWQSVLDQETGDLFAWNGLYRNADEDTAGACGSICGIAPSAGREIHMYGDKWVYLNDWVTFGGFNSAAGVSDLNWSPPFAESGLYAYGSIDTSHGNYFANNLYGGHAPYRVQTGDCGAAALGNYLNFKGNAGANGNNNCDSCNAYAFAWVLTPAGAGPQWGVGSDDGNRIWLNGTMIADNNVARGQIWDQDRFLPAGMAAGWNRVLFKVHNGGGGFSGVISLHNGGDFKQVEPSVYMQPDRYTGFSVGYEQDAWYPQIVPGNFYGVSSPTNGAAYYGNITTVAASGTSSGQGPVPLWRTMQYQWGYGLGNADSNYADVSGTPTATSWSQSTTGVTGHRRFHFFAVSQSGRTSFQDSGATGGSRFQDSGNYARYYDVYVDNVAPLNPSFSSVTAASPTQINLAWPVPLDQGVNVGSGSTESAGAAGNQDSQNWYRVGDVGVQIYRNGLVVSAWGSSTSLNDTGLAANSPYTYTLAARDNNTSARGAWNNATGPKDTNAVWTLSLPPSAGSISANDANPHATSNVTWTAVGGFGAGKVQYYRYAWDISPTHTWTESETTWSGGTLSTTPSSTGNWYLHVKGYNGADVANGAYDYAINAVQSAFTCSQTNVLLGIAANVDGTFTLSFLGTPQASYYVIANPNLIPGNWTALPGSTNTVTNGSGFWNVTVSNIALQQFYRSVALTPCP